MTVGTITPKPTVAAATNVLTPGLSSLNESKILVTASMTGIAIDIKVSPSGAIDARSFSTDAVNFVEMDCSSIPSSLLASDPSSAALCPVSSNTR